MLNEVLSSTQIFDKIEEIRKLKKWSYYKLAKEAGISRSSLYNWANNKSQPTLYLIESISEAFKMPITNLLFNDTELICVKNEELTLISEWHKLTQNQQKIIIQTIKEFQK